MKMAETPLKILGRVISHLRGGKSFSRVAGDVASCMQAIKNSLFSLENMFGCHDLSPL